MWILRVPIFSHRLKHDMALGHWSNNLCLWRRLLAVCTQTNNQKTSDITRRIFSTLLSEHLTHKLFSLQYSFILSPPQTSHPVACNQRCTEAKQHRKKESPTGRGKKSMSQKPKTLRKLQNSQACTSLILNSPSHLSSLIVYSLWTGLFSAAGRPLCTCWQPLWIFSAWPAHCPACGESAPPAASHLFPSSTTLCGRTWGLPPGSSRGRRKAQQLKNVKRRKTPTMEAHVNTK